jgi:hypothetical protein
MKLAALKIIICIPPPSFSAAYVSNYLPKCIYAVLDKGSNHAHYQT